MKHVLQRLYESEIDHGIHTLWDAGFRWWVGGSEIQQGGPKETGVADTYEAAVEAVRQAAIRLYPESEFAKEETRES